MKCSSILKKQSGESKLVPRSCKGDTAKKRERDIDTGLLRENEDSTQKQYLNEGSKHEAQINSLMSEVSALKQQQLMKAKVDQLLCKNDNRPLRALWEALNDKATPGIELPMAIVMDPRCGIERRAEKDDNLVDRERWRIDKSTPLMMAVRAHRNDVVEALLAAGADHSTYDDCFRTAYRVAAYYGNVTAMDLLFRYGADPFAVNASGCSALHLAARGGRAHAIQVLVELGASTEAAVEIDGETPLFRAACKGYVPSIVTLLNNGANLDAVTENRRTPLHWAILWGHIGLIETLAWEGASITAKDIWGRTPLEMFHQFSGNRYTDAEKARLKTLLTPTEFSI